MSEKTKIMIVDDEENIRFAFALMLEDEGYQVLTAADFESAMSVLSETQPDLVITDILLGGHTGIDLLAEIKKTGFNCPVIMITGEPNLESSANALRLGAFDYIPKPIRRETLLRITSHGLAHKRLLDHKQQLEKENRMVRKNMEAIFASLKDGVMTVDENLTIIEANKAVEKICALPVNAILGTKLTKHQTHCNGACLEVMEQTLSSNTSVVDRQILCEHQNRTHQVVNLTCTPLQSDGIHFSGAVLVIRNITKLFSLEKELEQRHRFHRIIGKSSRMQEIYTLMENLADTDSSVLISGESGTGKELIAHAIHYHSIRKAGPFVKVNCSALSENLLESELFGHVKGAFTGAVQDKKGRFELAHKGTLFLDEIGEISPLVQLKLLRVLQEKEFERVGDSKPIKTEVRILAATNRDLKDLVEKGEFRQDLYYRIKVVNINLPALRQRREDIPLLARHFLEKFNRRFNNRIKNFSDPVMAAFMNYAWPGNIRELEHAVEHGFVLCREDIMQLGHLPVEILKPHDPVQPVPIVREKSGVTRDQIVQALTQTGWNKAKAARVLGLGRRTIYRKIDAFNIENPEG